MIAVMPQMRLLLAVAPVDFRRGIDGLVAVCRQQLQAEPLKGALFIFIGRNRKSLKLLGYDGQGFWLAQKRLSQGTFRWWPSAEHGNVYPLEARQLQLLLWNGDPSQAPGAPLWRPLLPTG